MSAYRGNVNQELFQCVKKIHSFKGLIKSLFMFTNTVRTWRITSTLPILAWNYAFNTEHQGQMENIWNNLYQNVKTNWIKDKSRCFLDIITTLQEVSVKLLGLQRYITITKLRKRVLRRTVLQPCYSRRLEVKSLQTVLVFLQVVICSPDSRICRRPAHSLSLCRSFSVRPYYSLFQCMSINKSVFPE